MDAGKWSFSILLGGRSPVFINLEFHLRQVTDTIDMRFTQSQVSALLSALSKASKICIKAPDTYTKNIGEKMETNY